MNSPSYTAKQGQAVPKHRRRRRVIALKVVLILLLAGGLGWHAFEQATKPHFSVSKAPAAVVSKVIANTAATKHYDLDTFGVDVPSNFTEDPVDGEPPYHVYSWHAQEGDSNGQLMQIFEDTIPPGFAANRIQAVSSDGDHIDLDGALSDNCTTFTKNANGGGNYIGVPAKWNGVSFLCENGTTTRDVIGTSSTDGVDIVTAITSQGAKHNFLFTFTNQQLNADYSVFTNMITSFKMQ